MTYSQLSKKTDVFYFIFRGLLQNVRKEKTHFNSEGVNCHTLNFPLFFCVKKLIVHLKNIGLKRYQIAIVILSIRPNRAYSIFIQSNLKKKHNSSKKNRFLKIGSIISSKKHES